jgi:hypothetical protein
VDGNLKGAIEQYKKIAAQPGAGRATVATALLRMGQCYEKLGDADTQEARKAYEQVVREYADQAAVAAEARTKLAALAGAAGAAGTREAKGIVVRKVREGSGYGCGGSPSPDGKYFSDMEWKSGNLLVRNLSTGEERVLTESSGDDLENAFYSVFSPDGRKLAYSWSKKDGKFGIRTIGLDGSDPLTLIDDLAVDDIGPLGWTSDGQNILAFIWRNISI